MQELHKINNAGGIGTSASLAGELGASIRAREGPFGGITDPSGTGSSMKTSSSAKSVGFSNLPASVTAKDLKIVVVKKYFARMLRTYMQGGTVINLHDLKKFLKVELGFKNWDFGEGDCTELW